MSDAFDRIKKLYFKTTQATIARDFDEAVDLIKTLPDEATRERATVYMQGLAEMRAQWVSPTRPSSERRSAKARARSDPAKPGGRRPR